MYTFWFVHMPSVTAGYGRFSVLIVFFWEFPYIIICLKPYDFIKRLQIICSVYLPQPCPFDPMKRMIQYRRSEFIVTWFRTDARFFILFLIFSHFLSLNEIVTRPVYCINDHISHKIWIFRYIYFYVFYSFVLRPSPQSIKYNEIDKIKNAWNLQALMFE